MKLLRDYIFEINALTSRWVSTGLHDILNLLSYSYTEMSPHRTERPRTIETETAIIGTLASGQGVIDRPNSHLGGKTDMPLQEAFDRISLTDEQFTEQEVDLGRKWGITQVVTTNESDSIYFANRPKRSGHSRFVEGRSTEPTTQMVVVLKKSQTPNQYILITAYPGEYAGPEPWDPKATPNSKSYWQSHAFVSGAVEEVPGTRTDLIPDTFR